MRQMLRVSIVGVLIVDPCLSPRTLVVAEGDGRAWPPPDKLIPGEAGSVQHSADLSLPKIKLPR